MIEQTITQPIVRLLEVLGMRKYFLTLSMISSLLLVSCAHDTPKATGDDEPEQLYSMHLVDDGFDIVFTEIERGTNFSVARVELNEGTSVGSSMTLARAFWDIAVIRGFKYMATGRHWDDEDDPDVGYQSMYFTDDKDITPRELLGEDWNQDAQEVYEDIGYLDVKEWGEMMGWDKTPPLSEIMPKKE